MCGLSAPSTSWIVVISNVYMDIQLYFKCVFCGGALVNPWIPPLICMCPPHSANPYLVGLRFVGTILLRLDLYGRRLASIQWVSEYNYLGNGSRIELFRRKAGKVIVTAAAVYAAFLGLTYGVLVCGWIFRRLTPHFPSAYPRNVSRCKDRPDPRRRAIFQPPPVLSMGGDTGADSDAGAASSSDVSTHAMGRFSRQAHSVWISGLSAQVLNPSPCAGKRSNLPP